ncbi:hypothetical protein Drorol1_Dr00011637 [Drosera rotundifolia]
MSSNVECQCFFDGITTSIVLWASPLLPDGFGAAASSVTLQGGFPGSTVGSAGKASGAIGGSWKLFGEGSSVSEEAITAGVLSNEIYIPVVQFECHQQSPRNLVSLQLYDQYFLASSMDGSIKLYDNRQIQHGAVQSYEGHVNSHTRIQLAVDPYERFVASGGEDGKVRTWSIKSGELLLEDKISNGSIPTACWDFGMPRVLLDEREGHNDKKPRCSHPRQQSDDEWQSRKGIKWGVWLGMEKGLARVEF